MAGCVSDTGRSAESSSSGHCLHSREVLAEWRSSEQLENGTPSTSSPYWDIDDDDDFGPKPSQLYGKYTWKIEKYSQNNRKRELRSNPFEIGGYKWYILIYPQGCDVPNHLSLFLCVYNHDKLLPGWSHFAQFTVAVVNKDPKKYKYSDTLHRFRKKEHDWGWKKFMELPRVLDGFVDADTLIIRAQVQVIREKVDRPFRCLDCQYRRELMRVYLSNVEQICISFMEERRSKLMKQLEDKAKWESFCTFWLGVNQKTRHAMSKEKADVILKLVVKHFFIEKEVTSTLVMDSLYSGLRALLSQKKCKKENRRVPDAEEMAAPIVVMENDMFVLVDDVLQLLERAASEPLPPKDEKGPQNRTKDGASGEDFSMVTFERDEKRLTELGRRTVEIFILAHIFSNKIEVAYQEVNALRMQEELIREEETAWKDGGEHKAKHSASEKEKKPKKKQAKQKRNNRKGKNKRKDEMAIVAVQQKKNYKEAFDEPYATEDEEDEVQSVVEEPYVLEDVYDVSDAIDCVSITQKDSAHGDSDSLGVHYLAEIINNGINGQSSIHSGMSEVKIPSDDSSSTCSTDSFPSVVINGPYKTKSFSQYEGQESPSREKNQHNKELCEGNSRGSETDIVPSEPTTDASHLNDDSGSCKASECESEVVVNSLQDWLKLPEDSVVKKEKEVVSLQSKLNVTGQDDNRLFKEKTATPVTLSLSHWLPSKNIFSRVPSNSVSKNNSPSQDLVPVRKSSSKIPPETDNKAPHMVYVFPNLFVAKPDNNHNPTTSKPTEIPQRLLSVPRPSTAPIIPSSRPSGSVVSTVQTPSTTYDTFSRSYVNAVRSNTLNTDFSFPNLPDPHWADHYPPPQRERSSVHENSRNYMHNESRTEEYLSAGIETITSRKQPDRVLPDDYDFPHYDIINDLLEDDDDYETRMLNQNFRHMPDDYGFPHHGYSDSHYDPSRDMFSQGNNHHHMPYGNSGQIPGCSGLPRMSMPNTDGHDYDFPHHGYSDSHYDPSRDMFSQGNNHHHHISYGNSGQIPGCSGLPRMSTPNTDGHDYDFPHHGYSDSHYDPSRDMFSQGNNHHHMPYGNSRQIPRSGLPRMSMPNTDGHDNLYRIPPYSSLSSGVNGYNTVYRPPNGH